MTQSPITSEVHQPFDVHGDLCPEFTLDFIIIIDDFADIVDLLFRQIIGPDIRIDLKL
jgi:hypothetical protein